MKCRIRMYSWTIALPFYPRHTPSKNASEYCAQHLHTNLLQRLPADTSPKGFGGRMKKCLTDTFLATDKNFLAEASSKSPMWKDGCTATITLLLDQVIYAANVGVCMPNRLLYLFKDYLQST
eukprot:m.122306 g.122306  ORF g.122306 m.122306 type:complete len:122 (+) comp15543_c0_seq13:160-525(+)